MENVLIAKKKGLKIVKNVKKMKIIIMLVINVKKDISYLKMEFVHYVMIIE